MDDRSIGSHDRPISTSCRTVRKVGVLAVHEIHRIEATQFVPYRAGHEAEGARDHTNLPHGIPLPISQCLGIEVSR